MSGLRGAVAFLTRVPFRTRDTDLGTSVRWFPVVGAGVGGVAGLVYWGAAAWTTSEVAAVLAVATGVLITGALHEDGLADTFDGLSAIRSRERQLEIMRDSRVGAFGVAALVLVLLARVLAVASLPSTIETIGVLSWVHGVSRAVIVVLMAAIPAATDQGAAAAYLSGFRRRPAVVVAVALLAGGWWVVGERLAWVLLAAVAGPAVVAAWAVRRLGGITGDVLGACQQVSLVGALALVAS